MQKICEAPIKIVHGPCRTCSSPPTRFTDDNRRDHTLRNPLGISVDPAFHENPSQVTDPANSPDLSRVADPSRASDPAKVSLQLFLVSLRRRSDVGGVQVLHDPGPGMTDPENRGGMRYTKSHLSNGGVISPSTVGEVTDVSLT